MFIDREAYRKSESLTLPSLSKRVQDVKPHFKEEAILEKAAMIFEKGWLVAAKPATVAV